MANWSCSLTKKSMDARHRSGPEYKEGFFTKIKLTIIIGYLA